MPEGNEFLYIHNKKCDSTYGNIWFKQKELTSSSIGPLEKKKKRKKIGQNKGK